MLDILVNFVYNNGNLYIGVVSMVDILNSSMLDKNKELEHRLRFNILDILKNNSNGDLYIREYNGLNINAIREKLIKRGIIASKKDIYMMLQLLLSSHQNIVRDDYFSIESEYKILDDYYWKSKLQQFHYSFKDDGIGIKTMLLISDIHIGNDKIFNAKLLNIIYDYAIKNGATITINFGDLYEGLPDLNIDEYRESVDRYTLESNIEEFLRQVKIFINEYPNPTPKEMRTFCHLGNHDKTMQLFMKLASFYYLFRFRDFDLRMLSLEKQSFNMFLRSSWDATLNNTDFHFDHRLYKSGLFTNMKINGLDDIDKEKMMLESDYEVLISGHLHQGFIYPDKDYFKRYDVLYLGVPSTSNICIKKAVGYLLYMYPESNSMDISVLGCDNNLNIYEIDRIEWNFKSENKVRARML